MRRLLALLLPLAALATACPGGNQSLELPKPDADDITPDATINAEAGPPKPVKVMNWNTRNFYNDKRDSLEVDEANETILPTAEYQAKLTGIADVISSVKPDIVILIEVENQAVLDDLADKVGGYPHRGITKGNDPRGIDIAVMSKLEFDLGPSHKNEFFSASTDPTAQNFIFSRDVLEVHLRVNQRHFGLFGVHLKAKDAEPDSDLKRLAEAEQVRKIVTGIHVSDPSSALVVLGDFNDTPESPPLTALLGAPPYPFTSATAGLPASDRWSYTFAGNELIDDQLDDPNAAELLDAASVTIKHDTDATLSDHKPVIATYNIR